MRGVGDGALGLWEMVWIINKGWVDENLVDGSVVFGVLEFGASGTMHEYKHFSFIHLSRITYLTQCVFDGL